MALSKAQRNVVNALLRSVIADILIDQLTAENWDATMQVCRAKLFPKPVETPVNPCPKPFEAPTGGVTEPEPVAMVVPDVVVPTATKSKAKA